VQTLLAMGLCLATTGAGCSQGGAGSVVEVQGAVESAYETQDHAESEPEAAPYTPGWVDVPAGSLQAGCDEGPYDACVAALPIACFLEPRFTANLGAFQIDRYETTVSRYAECVGAGGCELPGFDSRYCNWGKPGRELHPINCVDWARSKAFCEWAGGRLCSGAEWERAARGPDGRKFPWGDQQPTCQRAVMVAEDGVSYGCGHDSTMPVGSRALGVSAEGVHDLAGNVWEWVGDLPVEGDGANDRYARGGGFVNIASFLVSWCRLDFYYTTSWAYFLGFRCCRSL
jgi:formylglycine-generating enzyme required for sulfatase activity